MRWQQVAESVTSDVRYALRGLRREPGYAATAVLTLALGLGAVTAMLAVADSVLLRPVALPQPQQLAVLQEQNKTGITDSVSIADVKALEREAHSFSAIAGWNALPTPIDAGDGARVQARTAVTQNFFVVAGVSAAQGRLLGPADAGSQNAVVSDDFWHEAMHTRRDALGSKLLVDRLPYTVVGVLPPGFRFPQGIRGPNVYTPLQLDAAGKTAYGFTDVNVAVRLRRGVSLAAANGELAALWKRIDPKAAKDARLFATNYQQHSTQDERGGLLALLGACALLLCIACVNFANLQIARYTARAEAVRVRMALGATRARLLRQLATESVLLASFGAALGLTAAAWIVHAARAAYAQRYVGFERLGVHPPTLAALFLLVLLVGVVTAVGPAWRGLRTSDGAVRLQASRTVVHFRASAWLVVLEIALTCVLVVMAGLMLRTFRAYVTAPLGFDPQHMTVVTLMPEDLRESVPALKLTEQRVLDGLRAAPGVQAVAVQLSVPFSPFNLGFGIDVAFPGSRQKSLQLVNMTLVDAGYLPAMGVHAIDGRGFVPDDAQAAPVVLVNEAFAHAYLSGGRAVGRALALASLAPQTGGNKDAKPDKVMYRVVGVVPDEIEGREIQKAQPMVYLDWQQVPAETSEGRFLFGIAPQFAVRSTLPESVLERELRRTIQSTAPEMAVMQIAPVAQAIQSSLDQQRLELRLAAGFGAIAVALAAVGIYGVLAYSVTQRRREIGIRMALGSTRAGAMRLVGRQAAWMVAGGLVAGFAAAWPAGTAVRAFLYDVKPLAPASFLAATCVLLLVCVAAAAVPAWRAARIDPMEALRTE